MRWSGPGVVLACVVLTAGCGSVPTTSPPGQGPATVPERPADRSEGVRSPTAGALADRVIRTARSLLATPYRFAGSDRSGFDCSGLTAFVFRQIGLGLPRTAAGQASAGRWVAPDELAGGDLVFFGDSRDKPLHVGLVISEPGEPLTMIHSSSSRGVVETEVVSDRYWLTRLKFGRRVLEE